MFNSALAYELAVLKPLAEPLLLQIENNGLEFIEIIRSNPNYDDLKLVMVTTETEPTRMARALMAGVDEFVMKPFTSEILVEKLQLIGVTARQID